MRLALVTGTVIATVKDSQLAGSKLLLADIIDATGGVLTPAVVAIDTVGAGTGDRVLIVEGSAARLASGTSAIPVDAAIVALVDDVTITKA